MPNKKTRPEDSAVEPTEITGQETAGEQPDNPQPTDPKPEAADELQALGDRYLRLNAEYVNYRNRTTREKESLWAASQTETMAAFLPVLDNLERALSSEAEDSAPWKGLEMILRQFREIMEKLGAKEIDALGKPFDPKTMDAVLHVEDEALGENTVSQVYTKGYSVGDRILRHAVVVVAN